MYDPHTKPLPSLTYVGHCLIEGTLSSEAIAIEAARLGGLPPGTPIDLYEQVGERGGGRKGVQARGERVVECGCVCSVCAWPWWLGVRGG